MSRLIELAEARFSEPLSAADETLFRQVGSGEFAHFGEGDPAEADKWDANRAVKADRIVWLCTDREAGNEVTHKGVLIAGARVEGNLDLSFAKIAFPLAILNSAIRDGILTQNAQLVALGLNRSHTGPIYADSLRVEHDLLMRDGFQATGAVRLLGAKIGGNLDCSKGNFSNPDGKALSADGVKVEGGVFLNNGFQAAGEVCLVGAVIGSVLDCSKGYFSNADGKSFNADVVTVEGGVYLRDGFQATGEVCLVGARIGGDLDCRKGNFSNPDGYALSADSVKVEGAVFFRDGFQATGEVRLPAATIAGNLECDKGNFSKPDGYALNADGMKVEGGVFLREGFQASGEVRLLAATIGGSLDCSKGNFSNPDGNALAADGVKVGGAVFLRDACQTAGEVRLVGATIGGYLDCRKGTFSKPNGYALNADGMKVEGGVFLREGFQATGEVRLLGATMGGNLDCGKGYFSNPDGKALNSQSAEVRGSVFLCERFQANGMVDFTAATVKRYFIWTTVQSADKCTLRLESAKIGTLWDEEESRPGKLYLDGLVYDRIHSDSPLGWEARLRWLRLQDRDKFTPQPYVQLASVLNEMGHEVDARKILIAKQEDPARVKSMSIPRRVWHHVLGLTIGYGYRPWQALLWILVLILLGWGLFQSGINEGSFAQTATGTAPAFNSFVYSVDAFVPLVDLHQAKYWLPTGPWLRLYLWVHISLGWVLSTLFVVGLTGLVRK